MIHPYRLQLPTDLSLKPTSMGRPLVHLSGKELVLSLKSLLIVIAISLELVYGGMLKGPLFLFLKHLFFEEDFYQRI